MYEDLTTGNRSFLKRFSHRRRFEVALDLMAIAAGDRVLDYGAGSGYMLSQLLTLEAAEIWAYEPDKKLFNELSKELLGHPEARKMRLIQDINWAPEGSFDKICCLEVLEHLPEHKIKEALLYIRRLLKVGACCVISVPLEIGLSALAKNCARFALRQPHGGATLPAIVKATLGIPVHRDQKVDFIYSHIGFDHRVLPTYFRQYGLRVLREQFSPFRQLGPVINSQVFYVLEKLA